MRAARSRAAVSAASFASTRSFSIIRACNSFFAFTSDGCGSPMPRRQRLLPPIAASCASRVNSPMRPMEILNDAEAHSLNDAEAVEILNDAEAQEILNDAEAQGNS